MSLEELPMAYTFNGIGTTYYGKKNKETRHGICDKCGWSGNLLSYETIYWFVIVYIPIIPLGRKQILDFCPECSSHRRLPLKEWKEIKNNSINEALLAVKKNPNDPTTGLETLNTLIAFNEDIKAEKLADILFTKHIENVEVQMQLLGYYENEGNNERADACIANALNADPSDLSVRRAAGITCLENDNIDKARKYLSFMEEAGEYQDPVVLFMLASAYSKQQNYNGALEIYKVISRDFPEIAKKDKIFRKNVQEAENKLTITDSILPKKQFVFETWMKWVAVSVAIIIGLFATNLYLKNNQTLHIINQTPSDANIDIPGQDSILVAKFSQLEVKIPEDNYTINVQYGIAPPKKININFTNNLFDRIKFDSVKLLNIGGGSVLYWQQTTYSEVPLAIEQPYKLYVGNQYIKLQNIDYLFDEFPETLSLDGGKSMKKTRLSVLEYQIWDILSILDEEKISADKILSYIEAQLYASPNNIEIHNAYNRRCITDAEIARKEKFLENGLAFRPISIEWHRAYQQALKTGDRENELIAIYDKMTAVTNVDNSALLYLRGRIENSFKSSLIYYDKAIKTDHENPYPLNSKAYGYAGMGEYNNAEKLCKNACDMKNSTYSMADLLYYIRFALGKFDIIEKETTAELKLYPTDWQSFSRLVSILSAKKDSAGIAMAIENFQSAITEKTPDDPYQYVQYSSIMGKYLAKDFKGLIVQTSLLKNEEIRADYFFQANLNLKNMKRVNEIMENKKFVNGYDCLVIWMGWKNLKNNKKASPWLDRAVNYFEAGPQEEKIIAGLLKNSEDSPSEKLDDITMHSNLKRILYTALAMNSANNKNKLKKRAIKLNYYPEFPYYFLKEMLVNI